MHLQRYFPWRETWLGLVEQPQSVCSKPRKLLVLIHYSLESWHIIRSSWFPCCRYNSYRPTAREEHWQHWQFSLSFVHTMNGNKILSLEIISFCRMSPILSAMVQSISDSVTLDLDLRSTRIMSNHHHHAAPLKQTVFRKIRLINTAP